jgi:hypothetical protein
MVLLCPGICPTTVKTPCGWRVFRILRQRSSWLVVIASILVAGACDESWRAADFCRLAQALRSALAP